MTPDVRPGEDFRDGPWRPARDGWKWTVMHKRGVMIADLTFWRRKNAVRMAHSMNGAHSQAKYSVIAQTSKPAA